MASRKPYSILIIVIVIVVIIILYRIATSCPGAGWPGTIIILPLLFGRAQMGTALFSVYELGWHFFRFVNLDDTFFGL